MSRREPAAAAWKHPAVVLVAPAQQGAAPPLSLSIARSHHRQRLKSNENRRQQMSQPPAPEPGVAPAEGLQGPLYGTPHHPRSRSRMARRDRLPRRSKEVRLALVHLHFKEPSTTTHCLSPSRRVAVALNPNPSRRCSVTPVVGYLSYMRPPVVGLSWLVGRRGWYVGRWWSINMTK